MSPRALRHLAFNVLQSLLHDDQVAGITFARAPPDRSVAHAPIVSQQIGHHRPHFAAQPAQPQAAGLFFRPFHETATDAVALILRQHRQSGKSQVAAAFSTTQGSDHSIFVPSDNVKVFAGPYLMPDGAHRDTQCTKRRLDDPFIRSVCNACHPPDVPCFGYHGTPKTNDYFRTGRSFFGLFHCLRYNVHEIHPSTPRYGFHRRLAPTKHNRFAFLLTFCQGLWHRG